MTRRIVFVTVLSTFFAACAGAPPVTDLLPGEVRRTPAEWEPQEAVWLQWPVAEEGDAVQRVFVDIVGVVAQYETVKLLAADADTRARGEAALSEAGVGGDVHWFEVPVAASWMRDNGPRYVELDGRLVLQNWEFDGYHDGRPRWMWEDDNGNPDDVAELLGMELERVALVHERGDLEVNGRDTALVNWSVVGHRNPGLTQAEATAQFRAALGVERVIYAEGYDPADVTRGHIDGLARFVAEDRVVVVDNGTQLANDVSRQIAEQAPDLTVDRIELYVDDPVINWLVGDGYVLTGSTGDTAADAEIAAEINERWFPNREVRFVDVAAIWANGGGVHCVTNDQPEAP